MAAVAVWNLWAVQGQMARLSALSDNTARVQEISINLQALRRANLRYIYDANEPAFKEAAEREAATAELLRAAAKSTVSEERLKIYNGLVGDVDKMKSLRERMGVLPSTRRRKARPLCSPAATSSPLTPASWSRPRVQPATPA